MILISAALAGDEVALRTGISAVRNRVSGTLLVGVHEPEAAAALADLDVEVRMVDTEDELRGDLSRRRPCAVHVAAETWAVVELGDCAGEPAPRFANQHPKYKAWDLARRTRVAGLAISGVGFAAALSAPALLDLARANRPNSPLALFGTLITLRYSLELGLMSWIVGHALEAHALRGTEYPRLTGDLSMVALGAGTIAGGLALLSLAEVIPSSPAYGWVFIGGVGSALALDAINMYQIGRPFGHDEALAWTVAPTPGGLAVLGRW